VPKAKTPKPKPPQKWIRKNGTYLIGSTGSQANTQFIFSLEKRASAEPLPMDAVKRILKRVGPRFVPTDIEATPRPIDSCSRSALYARHGRDYRDQPGLSLPSVALIRRAGNPTLRIVREAQKTMCNSDGALRRLSVWRPVVFGIEIGHRKKL